MAAARAWVWFVLISALLAGCTSPEAARDDASTSPRLDGAMAAAARETPDEGLPLATADPPRSWQALEVVVEVREGWVRPRSSFEVLARAPENASLVAYVAALDGRSVVRDVGGHTYVGGGAPGGHTHVDNATSLHVPLEVPLLSPGSGSAEFIMPGDGRFTFGATGSPHVDVNVTVDPAVAPREVVHVTLVDDEHGLRWAPADVVIHPATRVRFWNGAPESRGVVEERAFARVPGDARSLSLIAVDPGRYEVLVVAHDGGKGRGVGVAPVVIDFEAPSSRARFGPYSGAVSVADSPLGAKERAYPFTLSHVAREVAFSVNLTQAGVPARVSLALERDGEAVATSEAGLLLVEDVPAGDYSLRVWLTEGARASYEISGKARYRLAPPQA